MDQTTKTFFIIVAFFILAVFLFGSGSNSKCAKGEHYTAAFSPALRKEFDVAYTPDEYVAPPLTDDPFSKIYDHLVDENVHVLKEPKPTYLDAEDQHIGEQTNHHVFENDYVSNVNVHTSYYDVDLYADRIHESNNIANYCVKEGTIGDNADEYSVRAAAIDMGNPEGVYDMDMDDQAYYEMIMDRPNQKIFMRIDEDAGEYTQENNKGNQDIQNLAELSDVINTYRNDTLETIQGSYRGAANNRCGKSNNNGAQGIQDDIVV